MAAVFRAPSQSRGNETNGAPIYILHAPGKALTHALPRPAGPTHRPRSGPSGCATTSPRYGRGNVRDEIARRVPESYGSTATFAAAFRRGTVTWAEGPYAAAAVPTLGRRSGYSGCSSARSHCRRQLHDPRHDYRRSMAKQFFFFFFFFFFLFFIFLGFVFFGLRRLALTVPPLALGRARWRPYGALAGMDVMCFISLGVSARLNRWRPQLAAPTSLLVKGLITDSGRLGPRDEAHGLGQHVHPE